MSYKYPLFEEISSVGEHRDRDHPRSERSRYRCAEARAVDNAALPCECEPTVAVKRRLVLVALRESIRTRHAMGHVGGELHLSFYVSRMQTPKEKEPLCW
jgi:hypothetical protein